MTSFNFHHAIHIDFIQIEGKRVPWHVTITSATHPFETTIIGIDEDFKCTHADIKANLQVHGFPRPDHLKLDYVFDHYTIDSRLHKLFMETFWKDGWDPTFGAVNQATYNYLRAIFPLDVVLLPREPLIGEAYTLAAVYRKRCQKD